MSIRTDDLAAIFADTALTVPVVFSAQNARGFLKWIDAVRQDSIGDLITIKQRVVRVLATAFTGLANNSSITVDGATYKIHDIRRHGDGGVLEIVLA